MVSKQQQIYHGVEIIVYEKSILVGGQSLFFNRKPGEADVKAVQYIIDSGRFAMGREIRSAQAKLNLLIGC